MSRQRALQKPWTTNDVRVNRYWLLEGGRKRGCFRIGGIDRGSRWWDMCHRTCQDVVVTLPYITASVRCRLSLRFRSNVDSLTFTSLQNSSFSNVQQPRRAHLHQELQRHAG